MVWIVICSCADPSLLSPSKRWKVGIRCRHVRHRVSRDRHHLTVHFMLLVWGPSRYANLWFFDILSLCISFVLKSSRGRPRCLILGWSHPLNQKKSESGMGQPWLMFLIDHHPDPQTKSWDCQLIQKWVKSNFASRWASSYFRRKMWRNILINNVENQGQWLFSWAWWARDTLDNNKKKKRLKISRDRKTSKSTYLNRR